MDRNEAFYSDVWESLRKIFLRRLYSSYERTTSSLTFPRVILCVGKIALVSPTNTVIQIFMHLV